MHIHATVYQCTLNVLVPFIQWSTRWLCWHCFLSVHFFSHPTLSLSHREEACAVEAWYMPECLYWHWENDDQNVFMGWYSMVYYLSNTVCVFYFPRSWWGWLAGVFIKSLNLCDVDMKFQSRWLFFFFFFFFFSLCCWSVHFPWPVFGCFHCYCYMWRSKLSLGTQPA